MIASPVQQGERDLGRLLSALTPTVDPRRYAFGACSAVELEPDAFALIREAEGITVVRVSPAGEWARISLGVHSSLDAIGLTAALSARLADAGISANVIAGLYEDHLFVPWDRRDDARAALEALSAEAR